MRVNHQKTSTGEFTSGLHQVLPDCTRWVRIDVVSDGCLHNHLELVYFAKTYNPNNYSLELWLGVGGYQHVYRKYLFTIDYVYIYIFICLFPCCMSPLPPCKYGKWSLVFSEYFPVFGGIFMKKSFSKGIPRDYRQVKFSRVFSGFQPLLTSGAAAAAPSKQGTFARREQRWYVIIAIPSVVTACGCPMNNVMMETCLVKPDCCCVLKEMFVIVSCIIPKSGLRSWDQNPKNLISMHT